MGAGTRGALATKAPKTLVKRRPAEKEFCDQVAGFESTMVYVPAGTVTLMAAVIQSQVPACWVARNGPMTCKPFGAWKARSCSGRVNANVA